MLGCDAQRAEVESRAKDIQDNAVTAVNEKVDQGKQAASKAVDEKLKAAKDEASKAVNEKIDQTKDSVVKEATKAMQDAQQKVRGSLEPGKAFAEVQKQSIAMAESVRTGEALDPRVKEWISKTMANSNHAIQSLALPAMQQAYSKFPEHRAWLEKQVKSAAKASEGSVKQGWEDVLTNWERIKAIAESQR